MTESGWEHPRRWIAVETRSRLGVLNVALALGGRSTGWGDGGKPRRTFVGRYRHRQAPYHRAIDLVWNGKDNRRRVVLRVPLGSGVTTTWPRSRAKPRSSTPGA